LEKYKVAFASNDGESFNIEHFGDSNYYHIYDINQDEAKFVKTIVNNTREIVEEVHADPKKAKGVSKMLKDEGVQIVVSGVFGPNIKRINKQFVCLIFRDTSLSESIDTIKENYSQIKAEWDKGESRTHLIY